MAANGTSSPFVDVLSFTREAPEPPVEPLLEIVRDLLAGERNMQIDDEVASLHSLSESVPPQSVVVVIEADPTNFALACEILPNIRLVGIARDWRHASVRFNELSRERLLHAIRCVASEHVT
jgi:hypothetical protein